MSLKKKYKPGEDPTLKKSQADDGYFSSVLDGGDFRSRSNPTLAGYSSGYHEAAVTTDTYNFLIKAKDNGDGTHTLPQTAPKNSFWADYTGEEVYSKNLEYTLKYADGFRTDTAQTVLSAPGGLAAGHSGSNLDTTGQADAHNLLRQSIIDLLQTNPQTNGFSEESVVTTLAAITVTSIAPGEIARTVKKGSASLKSGSTSKTKYELNRNNAKRKVEAIYSNLTPAEQIFVNENSKRFMDSTQKGVSKKNKIRAIPSLRATSPERKIKMSSANEVAGGDYLPLKPTLAPAKLPPKMLIETGMYVTEDFRGLRRTITD